MLLGTMVDNLVVGGPAYNSRQLHHGDVIVKVDGIPITAANIHEVMVGDDIPGAPVVVSVARGGAKVFPIDSISLRVYLAREVRFLVTHRVRSSMCG